MPARLLASLVVVLLAPYARAADQRVLGRLLIVRNPSTLERRRIVVRARETESDDALVGDPVAEGASITITAHGATSSSATYQMPTGTSPRRSKPFWSGDSLHGFQYGDPEGENGPVRRAQIRRKRGVFQITANVDARLGTI